MSSILSSGRTSGQSPAYCKKNSMPGITPTINGLPKTLTAFVAYRMLTSGLDLDLNEVVHMRRNDLGTLWTGFVTDGNHRLDVTMTDLMTPNTYQVHLLLSVLGFPVASTYWTHHQNPRTPRWDTRLLTRILVPDVNQSACQIRG